MKTFLYFVEPFDKQYPCHLEMAFQILYKFTCPPLCFQIPSQLYHDPYAQILPV